jgi:hypothetical protein
MTAYPEAIRVLSRGLAKVRVWEVDRCAPLSEVFREPLNQILFQFAVQLGI